jgi:beta-galactosidase
MFCTESFPLEAYEYWAEAKHHPWVLGDFVWTSFDYIGEASIGWRGYMQEKDFYPWTLAFCGDIDICGWKRPQSYYRDALWSGGNTVSIFVTPPVPSFPVNANRESWSKWHWHDVVADWNWEGFENKPLEVVVYSSCDRVELFLNGKSLGTKGTSSDARYTATWSVPYQPGELKAVGYKGSKRVTTALLNSAGKPTKINLTADRSRLTGDGQDLSYVTVELLDEKGVRNPKAEDTVTFSLTGPGSIVAVANANPVSLESYQLPRRKAWQGRCLAVVRSGKRAGEVKLRASVEGLQPAEVTLIVGESK